MFEARVNKYIYTFKVGVKNIVLLIDRKPSFLIRNKYLVCWFWIMGKQENKNYTLLSNYRYERKFRPETLDLFQIKNIVLSSKALFRSIYHPRYINNIYLDNSELDAFYENTMGKADRKKYRVRWYGDAFGEITGAIFEIKIKNSYLGTKKSFFLKDFIIDKNFSNQQLFEILKNSEVPMEILNEIAGMEMKLLNRYQRSYYIDISGKFRLTTDSGIQYFRVQENFNQFVDSCSDREVVIEVKYDEEDNAAASGVINTMPFRMTRNSKYVDGISKFYDVTF